MKKMKSVNLDQEHHQLVNKACLELSLEFEQRISISSLLHILIAEHLDYAIDKRRKELNFEGK